MKKMLEQWIKELFAKKMGTDTNFEIIEIKNPQGQTVIKRKEKTLNECNKPREIVLVETMNGTQFRIDKNEAISKITWADLDDGGVLIDYKNGECYWIPEHNIDSVLTRLIQEDKS